jgi:hypothetical protein
MIYAFIYTPNVYTMIYAFIYIYIYIWVYIMIYTLIYIMIYTLMYINVYIMVYTLVYIMVYNILYSHGIHWIVPQWPPPPLVLENHLLSVLEDLEAIRWYLSSSESRQVVTQVSNLKGIPQACTLSSACTEPWQYIIAAFPVSIAPICHVFLCPTIVRTVESMNLLACVAWPPGNGSNLVCIKSRKDTENFLYTPWYIPKKWVYTMV